MTVEERVREFLLGRGLTEDQVNETLLIAKVHPDLSSIP